MADRRTPSQSRSTETVRAIVAAGASIVRKQGLAAFNTNAVALAAGVSIGSVYQYFSDKNALLVAILIDEFQALEQGLRQAIVEAGDLPLEAAVHVLLDETVGKTRPDFEVLSAIEELRPRLPASKQLEEVKASAHELHSQFFRRFGGAQGGVEDFAVASVDIFYLVRGILSAAVEAPSDQAGLRERLHRAVVGYMRQLAGAQR